MIAHQKPFFHENGLFSGWVNLHKRSPAVSQELPIDTSLTIDYTGNSGPERAKPRIQFP